MIESRSLETARVEIVTVKSVFVPDGRRSPATIAEVLRALAYSNVRKHIRADIESRLWFEDIAVLADLVAGDYQLHGVSLDPDDDKYMAAAVEGRAAFVVTG